MSTVRPSASALKRRAQQQHPYSLSPGAGLQRPTGVAVVGQLPKVPLGTTSHTGTGNNNSNGGLRVLSLQGPNVTPHRESPLLSRRGPHHVAPLDTPSSRNDFVEVNLSVDPHSPISSRMSRLIKINWQ